MEKKHILNTEWEFSLSHINEAFDSTFKIKKGKWLDASVPGTVHTDLLANKIIPDPFYADYEKYLQWISMQDWSYRTTFDYPEIFNNTLPVKMLFEGLDTVAEIKLNGKVIGHSENMFRALELDVTENLKEKHNKLEIFFRSPMVYAKEQENKYGKMPVALNSERVYIRKAQYSFGWDWGPSFATSGIWRNISLIQQDEVFITDYSFNTIEIDKNKAVVEVKADINTSLNENLRIEIQLFNESGSAYDESFPMQGQSSTFRFEISSPKLWNPNGYGQPNLYKLRLKLKEFDKIIDVKNTSVGIRKIELQLKEGEKDTFRFIINGEPIFARGVNWIPSDSFIPRTSEEKYRRLLQSAVNGNMNIVRVWGGGFYENEIFYELCDQLGLLVWQDFMFACASYPTHKEFIENISEEFDYNIKRLRNHPALAIWCGNNENEWIWFQEQKKSYKEMPGYVIYSSILPEKIKQLDPLRPYWESSPFSNNEDPNSEFSGNRHQWNIWSMWTDYNNVFADQSLFVTEFGFQGPANRATFEKVIPEKAQTIQSEIFEFHNKQVEGNERLIRFLAGHLPLKTDWKSFIYLAQLNQGLALSTCLYHWRSREPETNGSIIWQLNDCWPVSSWSLIDSDSIPKASYYMVKNIFNQQIILFRKNPPQGKLSSVTIILKNSAHENFTGTLTIKMIKLPSGKISLLKKSNIKSSKSPEDLICTTKFDPENSILVTTIYDEEKNIVHRSIYKEKEWKHLKLPKTKVKSTYKKKKNELRLTASEPALFVQLSKDNIVFDKNMIIILPGEEITVKPEVVSGKSSFNGKNFEIQTLNDYLH